LPCHLRESNWLSWLGKVVLPRASQVRPGKRIGLYLDNPLNIVGETAK